MFEEITLWRKATAEVAVRYSGFRNIDTGEVWIACANYLSPNSDNGDFGGDAAGLQLLTASFLHKIPSPGAEWKPSASEALEHFMKNNTDE